ncbi:MAG: phage terminase large subunit [Eubacteriales bacterium]|nr:phage terminase large subunit [Eubacteriales bacterium]
MSIQKNAAMAELARRELARRELARRLYREYLAYAHGEVWKRTRMSSFIADEVQRFIQEDTGHAYDILVVNCPPQHGKSMTISESLPSWYLGKYPDKNIILASYDSDFAERFCKKNKMKIRAVGKKLFGMEIGSIDRAAEFELSNGKGRFIARGIMSGITGNPANLVIIDDPVKNQLEADSPTYRQRLWDEWQASIKSRLSAGAKIIIIMTPWREDVFDREVIRTEKNVRHIKLPVEAGEKDPLGRQKGEPLCPELGKDADWLSEFRESYIHDPLGGQRAWTAMYLCAPKVPDGNLVKREWWKYYLREDAERRCRPAGAGAPVPEPEHYGCQIISVDAAFKGEENSDYVSIQVWGKTGNDYFLRYCMNRHLNFPETLDAIRMVSGLYPEARLVLIEEAANGAAIISVLQKELFVIPIPPKGGKVARVNAVSAAIESGHVYVPAEFEAPWVTDYLEQWSTFPNAAHDDMVDASSQALSYLLNWPGSVPMESEEDEQYEWHGEWIEPYK